MTENNQLHNIKCWHDLENGGYYIVTFIDKQRYKTTFLKISDNLIDVLRAPRPGTAVGETHISQNQIDMINSDIKIGSMTFEVAKHYSSPLWKVLNG